MIPKFPKLRLDLIYRRGNAEMVGAESTYLSNTKTKR